MKKKKISKKVEALNEALNIVDDIVIENKNNKQELLPKDENNQITILEKDETAHKEEIQEDYTLVRGTLRSLLSQGEIALGEMITLITESASPRMVEVSGGLIKNIADVGKTLMELHKDKQSLSDPKNNSSKNKNTTSRSPEKGDTNIYIGTTAEMAEKLDKEEKNKK